MMASPSKNMAKYVPRLQALYIESIQKELKEELKLHNINEVPTITKVTLNVGLGKAKDDKKILEVAANTLEKITGQKPITTVARGSIAGFKLREGNRIGLKTTLRGHKMYEFIDRFVNIVLPRFRDFRGVKLSSFDSQGNYSIGIQEQSVFPELSFEETTTSHGLQVTISIRSKSREGSKLLLEKLGMPFEKESK